MAILKRLRSLKAVDNTGFGTASSNTGGRFFNKDGNPNSIKKGVGLLERYSWFHTLLEMPNGKFVLLLLSVFVCANLVYASIYYLIGVEHLNGISGDTAAEKFSNVFFFSVQTFTTVGYGHISPNGFWASAVAMVEAFTGLLSFAIATGLFYGRFSRPRIYLKFSKNVLIAPYRDGTALMFRLSPYKNNALSEATVSVTLAISTEENGRQTDKFFGLDLQIATINVLALSWTIVHPINEKSPFWGFTKEDFEKTDMELMVFVKAFDEVFSNNVIGRTSYITPEFVYGAKFNLMYQPNADKTKTVLDLDKLNDFDAVPLPEPVISITDGLVAETQLPEPGEKNPAG